MRDSNVAMSAEQQVIYLCDALREIAQGRGAFSLDHFTHANNAIENMKRIANEALAGTWENDDV